MNKSIISLVLALVLSGCNHSSMEHNNPSTPEKDSGHTIQPTPDTKPTPTPNTTPTKPEQKNRILSESLIGENNGETVTSKISTSPICDSCTIEHTWTIDSNNSYIFGDVVDGEPDDVIKGNTITDASKNISSYFVKSETVIKDHDKIMSSLTRYYKNVPMITAATYSNEEVSGDIVILDNGDVRFVYTGEDGEKDRKIGRIQVTPNQARSKITIIDTVDAVLIQSDDKLYIIRKFQSDGELGVEAENVTIEPAPIPSHVINVSAGGSNDRYYQSPITVVLTDDGNIKGWTRSTSKSTNENNSYQPLNLNGSWNNKVSNVKVINGNDLAFEECSASPSEFSLISTNDGQVYLLNFLDDGSNFTTTPRSLLLGNNGITQSVIFEGALYIIDNSSQLWVVDLTKPFESIKSTYKKVMGGDFKYIDTNNGVFVAREADNTLHYVVQNGRECIGSAASDRLKDGSGTVNGIIGVYRYTNINQTKHHNTEYLLQNPLPFSYYTFDTNKILRPLGDNSLFHQRNFDGGDNHKMGVLEHESNNNSATLTISDITPNQTTHPWTVFISQSFLKNPTTNRPYIEVFGDFSMFAPNSKVDRVSMPWNSIIKTVATDNTTSFYLYDDRIKQKRFFIYTDASYRDSIDRQLTSGIVSTSDISDVNSSNSSLFLSHEQGGIDIIRDTNDPNFNGYRLNPLREFKETDIHN
ncbi:hypothetical protein [Photobacterium damselae]|uniref:hypothetical protein n=1 Tax=Photobacterium damselae TaxID=38293 RepID=UPI004067F369